MPNRAILREFATGGYVEDTVDTIRYTPIIDGIRFEPSLFTTNTRKLYGFNVSPFGSVTLTETELKQFVREIQNKTRMGIKVSDGGE